MNYKILVQNSKRKTEAQKLFFELGYKWNDGTVVIKDSDCTHLVAWDDGKIIDFSNRPRHNHTGWYEMKELVISELRDMVVLRRNDLNDRNVYDPENPSVVFFLDSSKKLFFFSTQQKWEELLLSDINDFTGSLLPIEREMKKYSEVKEYLDPDNGYVLITADDEIKGNSNWIEVPHGADTAVICRNNIIFWKGKDLSFVVELDSEFNHASNGFMTFDYFMEFNKKDNPKIVWQRSEMEKVQGGNNNVKHSHYKKDVSHLDFIDVYRVLDLFEVSNPCLQHAIKKLLCAGQRGTKDESKDIQETIDTLIRFQEMRGEDESS